MPSITVDFSDLENVTADVIVDPLGDLEIVPAGVKVKDGRTIPAGGTTGQVLGKVSDDDFDHDWVAPSQGLGTPGGASTEVFEFVSNGDNNGAFYRIGTDFGAQAWANPQDNGLVVTSNNSPQFGSSLTNLTDRITNITNTVILPNTPGNWIKFDMGADRILIMTDWLFRTRQDDNASHPEQITVEGSNDDTNWFPVDFQDNIGFTAAGEWRLFTLGSPSTAYRYFRFTQTDVNSDNNNFFTASEFEFYGTLTFGSVTTFTDGQLAAFVDSNTLRPLRDELTTPVDGVTVAGYLKTHNGTQVVWIPYYI